MNVTDLSVFAFWYRKKIFYPYIKYQYSYSCEFLKFINKFVNIFSWYKLTINKEIDNGLILLSTFPDEESLIDLSKTLIKDKKLCACVNYTRINSLYMWKNDLKQESEFLALYKTTSKCVEQLKTEILKKHPYEMPEVVILTMKDVSHGYLNWLIDSTK